MRIMIMNYEFPPLGGGGGVACYQIARELAKTHQVDYITTAFKGLPKFEVIDKINVYRVPVIYRKELSTATLVSMLTFFPSSFHSGLELCKKNKYDLILAWFAIPSGLTSMLLSKLFRVPHILTIIGGDIYDPSKKWSPHNHFFLRKIVELIMDNSNMITSISTDTKNRALQYYRTGTTIKPISLGFVKPEFKKNTREELGLLNEDIILISVGRLIKRKGYEYAIKALSKLPFQNLKYLIIGDGPEEKNLQDLAKRLGIEDKIKFLGFVSEEKKFQYLSISNIYVLSSLHEGFGICLMEAMYCSMPIVATNNGGQNDFLVEGKNALMVQIEDGDALAEQIENLIKDRKLRLQIGENNKEDVKKFYIENIGKEYERIFKKVIDQKKINHCLENYKGLQKRYYNKESDTFDKGYIFGRENRNHYKKIKKISELLNLHNSHETISILEVGAGTGIHAKYIRTNYDNICYTGIDISEGMVHETRKRLDKFNSVALLVGDGERLPIKDNTFDVAFVSGSLHHFSNPMVGISELVRIIKNGGKIAVMEPNWIFPTNFLPATTQKAERGILKMSKNNLKNWAQDTNLYEIEINNFIYTPPVPKYCANFYDFIDNLVEKIPLISSLSIMLYLSGVKKENNRK